MHKHGMPEMKEGSVNVTPLIDIIMCLIIFFMIVAKIGVSPGLDSDLIKKAPATFRGEQITDFANAVVINVNHPPGVSEEAISLEKPDVRLIIEGVETKLKVDHRNKDGSELRNHMKKLRDERKDSQGNEKLKVILNAPASLKYFQLQQVLADLTTAGITDIYFATNATGTQEEWDKTVQKMLDPKNQ